MNDAIFKDIFNSSSIAKSIHQLVRDDHNEIIGQSLLHCNNAFLQLFHCENLEEVIHDGLFSFFQISEDDIVKILKGLACAKNKVVYRNYSNELNKLLKIELTLIDDRYIACQIIDKTEEFLHDDYFDDFLNNNLVMLSVTSKDRRFLNVNNEFESILGFSKEELIGHDHLEFIHPDDIERTKIADQELRKEHTVHSFMNRYRHKDGSYRYLSWRSQIHGDVVFSSALDVTENVITQQKLMKANEQLLKHAEEIQKVNQYLEKLSMTDMLTGIYNRRYINRKISEESKRMVRYNYPLSMIFFDLDHFKSINDTYGHVVGDEIIKITCDLVSKNIRATDIFGRWGGEEFVVIAPHTTQDEAVILAEKLRTIIADYNHSMIGKFTCSFGVVEYNRKESIKEFYERADDALYHAKMDGRNRVFTTSLKEKDMVESVYLEWDPSVETGNQTIDRQHMSIVKRANELIDLLLMGEESENIFTKMKRLMELIAEHFQTETAILEKMGYPNILEHKKMHHKLEEKGEQFIQEYKEKKLRPTAFFAFVVDDVVFGHLMKEDKQYIPFIKPQKQL